MNPNIIPGYRIERRIGKGGMASVYLAIQESLHRAVALKILTNFDSPEFSERFLNEGRTIAQLSHTNIITIHDIGIANGLHYISMEYIEGGDLKQRIKGDLGPEFALNVIEQMASALRLAHRRNMVHRDVKPPTSCSGTRPFRFSPILGSPSRLAWKRMSPSPERSWAARTT